MNLFLIRVGSAKALTLGPGGTIAEAIPPRHFEPG
jgi:hypothetical protein